MNLSPNIPLQDKTTIRTPAIAKEYLEITSVATLIEAIKSGLLKNKQVYILGEGSNTLFTKDFDGLIIRPQLMGLTVTAENETSVTIRVGAGESWPEFVEYTVKKGWSGIENLALIPGTVGAAPIQNIAAYGQSQADVFVELEAINLGTGKVEQFSKPDCRFAYRDSSFKHHTEKRLITAVIYRLSKVAQLNTQYFSIGRRRDSITTELEKMSPPPYVVKDVFQAVVNIRSRKLPNWKTTPTFGSYFKNPLVTKSKLQKLQSEIPDLQFYPADSLSYKELHDPAFDQAAYVKVPVGRLLDHLGWAKRKIGHVHTYKHWASIVTHDGQATGKEVHVFTREMQNSVKSTFGIELDHEVVVL